MARFILWAILIMLAVRAASKLVRGLLEGAGYRQMSSAPEPRAVGLVRDPVCGVYVVPGQALTSGTGPAMKHFCSEKCRREWTQR